MTNLIEILKHRYTTKAYEPGRRLPDDIAAQLLAALRYAPSSVNSQPWHFVVADDDAGKARIAKSVANALYNLPKIRDASLVVAIFARDSLPADYLRTVLDQEQADGRFADEAAREAQGKGRGGYVALHERKGDVASWAQKQAYIALGFGLLSAAVLGVDATPIEGFDPDALDAEFDLKAKGFSAAVIVSFGYHAESDPNAKLPKSRLPESVVFSRA